MKKIISLLLCLTLLAGMSVTARALDDFELGQTWDQDILAGGIYDMFAWVGENPDDYTYQWQVDVGIGEGHWYDLEDNADPYGYRGTDTYHLEFVSPKANGHTIDSGWNEIPFCCKVANKKTGQVKYTPNIYMNIYSSDDLDEYMAKKGVKLFTPSAGTNTPSTTTDGVTYYTSAEGRQKLTLFCGYSNPVNVPLMARSELRADIEIWVTEDGKTTKASSPSYFPYTLGKDTVSVDFKMHYQIGATDLGYYQTKTLKISVTEPTVVGCGTAKQEMSLLKDPYSQSQKLVQIPQGETVNVYDNSGSWYLVGHGGYIGYVAGSSLGFSSDTSIIEDVELSAVEPVAGEELSTAVTVKPDSCTVTSVEWLDKTEDRFMESGERFVEGHDYQLVVWVSAKDGCSFRLDGNNDMLTTAMLNGNKPCFTSRAYEQVYGKVIDIRYDFSRVKAADTSHLCAPTAVAQVSATCTDEGCKAYYHCTCGTNYADAAATEVISLSQWSIPATGHKAGSWTGNGTHHYQKCTVCRQVITGTNAPHAGGTATCLQKAACDTCGMQYGQTSDHKWSPRHHSVDANTHAYQCADCKAYDAAVPHTPGPAATETAPQTCTDCGYVIVPAKNHTHTYLQVAAKEATCLTPGNLAYYTCDGCSQWWLDATGTKPVNERASVLLLPLGHFTGEIWKYDEQTHWQNCAICMTMIQEGLGDHCDGDNNGICDICLYGDEKILTSPAQPPEEPQPSGSSSSSGPSQPQANTQSPTKEKTGSPDWLAPVLVALFSFVAAITATLIILKKKK